MDQFQAMRTKNFDNRLLILQVIHEYCKKNISTIRRFNLKELCNNRLFDALLKACYDKVDIPEVKILECYGSKIDVIFPCDIHQLL